MEKGRLNDGKESSSRCSTGLLRLAAAPGQVLLKRQAQLSSAA